MNIQNTITDKFIYSTSFPITRNTFQAHPFHVTKESPWPILTAGSVLATLASFAQWFNNVEGSGISLTIGLISTVTASVIWWADVVKESTIIGLHTKVVARSHAIGVSLFIVTEAIVFVSIFWAYFHSSLAPTVELGTQWPPVGITALSPITIPFSNTILLISSGATVTFAHHAIFKKDRQSILEGIIITILLAIVFTGLQGYEYSDAPFSIHDGAYGTCFYFGTGGHGIHVIVGTLFLAVAIFRAILYHFTSQHHVGIESPILYWHFVDAVWLFLFVSVYWWGSNLCNKV